MVESLKAVYEANRLLMEVIEEMGKNADAAGRMIRKMQSEAEATGRKLRKMQSEIDSYKVDARRRAVRHLSDDFELFAGGWVAGRDNSLAAITPGAMESDWKTYQLDRDGTQKPRDYGDLDSLADKIRRS